ncbi:hypothetical protein SJAV_20290 [Sulfurisphaera javensis]|uniref:Uncharacterized protein n=1 Tax=Sulfurisphaera javensis TaxID=2049879 RepID=A0AAT9GTQ8_9CREN
MYLYYHNFYLVTNEGNYSSITFGSWPNEIPGKELAGELSNRETISGFVTFEGSKRS